MSHRAQWLQFESRVAFIALLPTHLRAIVRNRMVLFQQQDGCSNLKALPFTDVRGTAAGDAPALDDPRLAQIPWPQHRLLFWVDIRR
jgi:hypothetical protein